MSARRPTIQIIQGIFLFCWLCQALGFAVPAISSATDQTTPRWEQATPENLGYDSGFQSRLSYDAELPGVTTEVLSEHIGVIPISPAYDPTPVFTIRVVGTPGAAPVVEVGFLAAKTIDPSKVRFSQSSIKSTFKDGGSLDDLVAGLRNGTVKPGDVPPIRLVERDGQLFTLDNRRLEAFRQAGVEIPYRMATPEEIAAEGWKFTTQNGGTSIRVRGQ